MTTMFRKFMIKNQHPNSQTSVKPKLCIMLVYCVLCWCALEVSKVQKLMCPGCFKQASITKDYNQFITTRYNHR